MTAIRVLVADDHAVVRQGVRAVLEGAGFEVCGEAETGREAVEMTERLDPAVVVLDVGMPELNGLEATRQITQSRPGTEVLVLTMHESEQLVREVLDAGARGYVLKSDAGRELVAAVESLSAHKPYFTSRVAEIVVQGYLRGGRGEAEPSVRRRLTPREREIVQLVAEGKSNKTIAAMLGISVKTVETHRANVMRRLDLSSVSDLVRYAIRNQLIEP